MVRSESFGSLHGIMAAPVDKRQHISLSGVAFLVVLVFPHITVISGGICEVEMSLPNKCGEGCKVCCPGRKLDFECCCCCDEEKKKATSSEPEGHADVLKEIHEIGNAPALSFDLLPGGKGEGKARTEQYQTYVHRNPYKGKLFKVTCIHSKKGPRLEVAEDSDPSPAADNWRKVPMSYDDWIQHLLLESKVNSDYAGKIHLMEPVTKKKTSSRPYVKIKDLLSKAKSLVPKMKYVLKGRGEADRTPTYFERIDSFRKAVEQRLGSALDDDFLVDAGALDLDVDDLTSILTSAVSLEKDELLYPIARHQPPSEKAVVGPSSSRVCVGDGGAADRTTDAFSVLDDAGGGGGGGIFRRPHDQIIGAQHFTRRLSLRHGVADDEYFPESSEIATRKKFDRETDTRSPGPSVSNDEETSASIDERASATSSAHSAQQDDDETEQPDFVFRGFGNVEQQQGQRTRCEECCRREVPNFGRGAVGGSVYRRDDGGEEVGTVPPSRPTCVCNPEGGVHSSCYYVRRGIPAGEAK